MVNLSPFLGGLTLGGKGKLTSLFFLEFGDFGPPEVAKGAQIWGLFRTVDGFKRSSDHHLGWC